MELWSVPDSLLCFSNSPDVTWVKPHSKSTAYRDQHYYKGYHPNLAASPSGQDR